ncbi:DUF1295 domain-containing protein [Leucobacter sp. cx-42]|uniref:DUF1295 domain-containing protein n=1 Tax=unclassified Leucobacter TaxID=2621730 RepID=UPI00165D733B|nr:MULTISPECIES: DUF1295 domain-containing protein [unclassified Leucobacter]MBC9953216.1 DUF1295 domain-containing protein [Leucobacter sp. cx-42]
MTKPHPIALTVIIGAVIALGVLLALAGSQGGWTLSSSGPLPTIPGFAFAVLLTFLVQWFAFIPSAFAQTDRYFDATGSITYIVVTTVLVVLSPSVDVRDLLLACVVIVWAARLGSFLFARNIRSGRDDRFDDIKTSKLRFLLVWTLQALWVSLTAAAAWISLASSSTAPLDWTTWVGLSLWLIGFTIEVVADVQKNRFKTDPRNHGRFISTGLWSVSQHPNYFGEIILWIGVLLIAAPALHGWQWVALFSPVFVILLLTKVSGIPTLEKKAAEKWGDDPEYQRYQARTSKLIIMPSKNTPAQ